MSQPLAGTGVARDLRPWVARMVRIGYAAKGIIYLLIGVLAFRLAAGLGGGRLTDPDGVLLLLFRQPFGQILLLIVGIGILAYSAWQFVDAIWDNRRPSGPRGWWDRTLTMIKGAVYGTVGWQAIKIVLGLRRQQEDLAADVMRFPFGDVLLGLVGLGVAIYGAFEIKDAVQSRFGDDLDAHRLRAEAGGWATAMGRIGNGARGVILVLIGIALAGAGFKQDPNRAGGIAEALASLFFQPYGIALTGAVAAGLACFGVFQLLHARYARL